MKRTNEQQYSAVSVLLHWLTAVAVLMLLILGYTSQFLEEGADKVVVLNLHKALGFSLLVLVLFRWLWMLATPTPTPLPEHDAVAKRLVKVMRWTLMLLLVVQPVSGLLQLMYRGEKLDYFGMFFIHPWVDKNEQWADFFATLHQLFAMTILVAVSIHILFALRRHFAVGDDTLRRILGKIYT